MKISEQDRQALDYARQVVRMNASLFSEVSDERIVNHMVRCKEAIEALDRLLGDVK